MHQSFANKIGTTIHKMKYGRGMKPEVVAKWFRERFPHLTQADAEQVKDVLRTLAPKKGGPSESA